MRDKKNGKNKGGKKKLVNIISKLAQQQLSKGSEDEVIENEEDAVVKNEVDDDSVLVVESSPPASNRRSKRKPEKTAKSAADQPAVEEIPNGNVTIVEAVLSDDDFDEPLQQEEVDNHVEENVKKKKTKKHKSENGTIEITDTVLKVVNCTACNDSISTKRGKFCRHPDLNTIMCKQCYKFYSSGKFTKDEYGVEEFCRWCADGGQLICCDFCEKAFCKKCVKRNLGKTKLQELLEAGENEKWSCFCCDPTPISSAIKMCNRVMHMLDEKKDQNTPYKDKKGREIIHGPNRGERRTLLTSLSNERTVKSEINSKSSKNTYSKDFENGESDVNDKNEGSCDDNEEVVVKKESDKDGTKTIVTTVESSEEDFESDKASNPKKKFKGAGKTQVNNHEEKSSSDSDVPQRKRTNKKKKNDDSNSSSPEKRSRSKKKNLAKKEREKSKSARKKNDSDSADDYVQIKNRKKGKDHKTVSSDEESDVQSSDEQSESSEQDSSETIVKRKKNRRQVSKSSDSETDSDVKVKKHRKKKSISKTRKVGRWSFRRKRGASNESESDRSSGKENAKKSKAKKKVDKKKKRKVKRKRSDEDDEDESDDEDASPSKKGRRKIRKILDNEKLTEATRHARQLEEERRQRLLEKTKSTVFQKPEIVNLKDVVLEYKADKKTPLIEVNKDLVKHLKPHQVDGLKFMYDCTIESVERWSKKEEGGGCILAHVMGLGKTLQVVTLVHTLYHSELVELRRVLVVCPLNTVLNWETEFEKWLNVDERLNVYVLNETRAGWHRADMLKDWMNYGGVLIIGYTMYRNLSQCLNVKNKRQKKIFKECLVDPGPELVVCDEGHILRNSKSGISIAMNGIKTRRRIVLTGTPLQNNLQEYHCMVSFVKPNLLGSLKEFSNSFIRPIENGQCADSTVMDVSLMKRRCHVLHKMLAGCVQRKDYAEIAKFLPAKFEYVIKVRLTDKQREMYKYYLDTFLTLDDETKGRGGSLFSDYQALMRIWTHPWSLKLETARQIENFIDTDDSLKDFVVESEGDESAVSSEEMSWSSDAASDSDNDQGKRGKKRAKSTSPEEESEEDNGDEGNSDEGNSDPEKTKTRSKRRNDSDKKEISKSIKADPDGPSTSAAAVDDDDEVLEVKPVVNGKPVGEENENGVTMIASTLRSGQEFKDPTPLIVEEEWYDKFLTEEDEKNVKLGSKIVLLLEILADAAALEEKVILFSHSLISLDVIEMALGGGEIGGNSEDWCRGCDYFRMDGSTSAQMRKRWADIFNDEENKAARLFLISTKAGGLGINLVGASRVVVFDISWNPSHDVQSIFRAYRFGQKKPVFVYRFIAEGTMEEKIYDRQVTKLSMSQRVVDEQQIQRHFNANDLAELYRFEPDVLENENDERPTPVVPKDAILAELINRLYPKWIVKYLEHDSLLQNRPEEELTEAERKEAWDHWEREKEGVVNAPQIRAEYIQQMVNGLNLQIPNFPGAAAGLNPNIRSQFTVGGLRPSAPPQNAATFAGVQRPPNYQQIVLEEQRRRLFEMERRRIQESERRTREEVIRMQSGREARQRAEQQLQQQQQQRKLQQQQQQQQRQRAEQQLRAVQQQQAEQQRRQQEARQQAEQQQQRIREQQQAARQRLREQQQQQAEQQRLQREREQRKRATGQQQSQEQQQQQIGQEYLQQLLQNRNAYVTQQPSNGNQRVIQIVLDNDNVNNNPIRPQTSQRSPARIIELPPDA